MPEDNIPLLLNVAPSGVELTRSTFLQAMSDRPIDEFDASLPLVSQMSGRRAVVDLGGWGRREHTRAAVDAGVRLWHVLGYGLDHLDLAYLLQNDIEVAHTPGSCSAVALAEHAMLLLLATVRSLAQQERNLAEGVFYVPWSEEVAGKTLLLVGVGASGLELGRRASGFGMHVIGVDVNRPDDAAVRAAGISHVEPAERLLALLPQADVVSLHLPLNESTFHLIDRSALEHMRPTAVLINVARGSLVDEAALLAALEADRIGGAGLDVFEKEPPSFSPELACHPHVFATPHTAGSTIQTMERRSRLVVENLDRLSRGETILHTVSPSDGYIPAAHL